MFQDHQSDDNVERTDQEKKDHVAGTAGSESADDLCDPRDEQDDPKHDHRRQRRGGFCPYGVNSKKNQDDPENDVPAPELVSLTDVRGDCAHGLPPSEASVRSLCYRMRRFGGRAIAVVTPARRSAPSGATHPGTVGAVVADARYSPTRW